tara:strand:+ start:19134 stop:20051 length:918 start_codon:yes stop_codon:yes gene_type:complete
MADYLVTGAAGFVGSALGKRLVSEGHNITSIDNLSTGYEYCVPSGVELIKGDCADPQILRKLNDKRFDAVFHIAGQSSGEVSFEDPTKDLRDNTESTLLLLDYCLKHDCQRFIYASTMSVYGTNDVENVDEDTICNPKSFYAVGKLASEKYMNIYSKLGIHTTALRLFNVFGPGQNMSNMKQGMLSIYLAQFLDSEEVIVKGSSDRYRDFIYIDDVVESFVRALSLKKDQPKIINVGTGRKTTVENLIRTIIMKTNLERKISYLDGTPGDLKGITASIDLMNDTLGDWEKTLLDDGLLKMINHLK